MGDWACGKCHDVGTYAVRTGRAVRAVLCDCEAGERPPHRSLMQKPGPEIHEDAEREALDAQE